MLKRVLYAVFLILLFLPSWGQRMLRNTRILNYQRGDYALLHFGFTLGINYMDYRVILSGENTWRAETGKLKTGFSAGLISELRLADDWGLRFLPGLDFSKRRLVFTNIPEAENNRQYADNESVYLSLPVVVKYKAKRINNFRPFLTAGGSYRYDFHRHNKIEPEKSVFFRTRQGDAFLELGGGSDFYLPYCKFGIELRFSLGLTDALVHQPDPDNSGYEKFTQALKKLRARMFTVCFNFE